MQPIHIENITQLHQIAGLPNPQHPLFSIFNVETLAKMAGKYPLDLSLGFYTIGLLRNVRGKVICGRKSYDFGSGTMFFISPNQIMGHSLDGLSEASGWLLFFHRAYLANHPLSERILNYGFFDYDVTEALHLSDREERSVEVILENMQQEYAQPIDKHSRSVVLANLDLLLTYGDRYYGRQFITRQEVEGDFLTEFERRLQTYFKNTDLEKEGIPSINYFAEQLHLSPKYLSDKLKNLTGKTAQEHIQMKVLENAKVLLRQKEFTVAEVAYQLGFEYPPYFSRLFKKKVGMSPTQYRVLN